MKVIAILLIITGILGVLMGSMMYGDIGLAAIIGAAAAMLSGIGFLGVSKNLKNMKQ